MVLASASSTVAGRTCRDHGGLVQPRKRRPHGSNGSRTSSVLFEIPSNFARPVQRCTRPGSSHGLEKLDPRPRGPTARASFHPLDRTSPGLLTSFPTTPRVQPPTANARAIVVIVNDGNRVNERTRCNSTASGGRLEGNRPGRGKFASFPSAQYRPVAKFFGENPAGSARDRLDRGGARVAEFSAPDSA